MLLAPQNYYMQHHDFSCKTSELNSTSNKPECPVLVQLETTHATM